MPAATSAEARAEESFNLAVQGSGFRVPGAGAEFTVRVQVSRFASSRVPEPGTLNPEPHRNPEPRTRNPEPRPGLPSSPKRRRGHDRIPHEHELAARGRDIREVPRELID